jgi:Type IIA topoisomerase (DNA gyrase/topo II, topoisomerase IV), B subunit
LSSDKQKIKGVLQKMKTFDKVRSLDDREQAREKLPVWYGSRSNYYHGFREVCINNPIDEISNNFKHGEIFITLHDDMKTVTVSDTGRGMPIHLKDDKDEAYWYFILLVYVC